MFLSTASSAEGSRHEVYGARMKRTFISIHQSATKKTVFGRLARKQMSERDSFIVEREKFAPHVMVSVGVCFGGKSRLHFVGEKAKVNAEYNVGRLLPELIADFKQLLPAGFIFQQDGAPAHTAFLVQDWLNLSFIEKDQFSRFEPSGLSRVGCFAGEMS